MKTILVPTDFSDNADNAINYAAEIAKFTEAKLVLFHAFHPTLVPMDAPVIMPLEGLEKDSFARLKKIKKNILHKYGNELNIVVETKCGFAVDEINRMIKGKKIDLVVMGMRGAGYLTEKLIGSIATILIRKTTCPVLAINENVKYTGVNKIVLACDFQKIQNKSILEPLKEFVKLFKSHLYILNVTTNLKAISLSIEILANTTFGNAFEGIDHSFHLIENEEIVDGINDFVNENKIDMVVMMPHKHSMLETIFQERNTKRMAFHTHIPLLALNESV